MNMVIQRIFGTSISGQSKAEVVTKRVSLEHIRNSLRQTLHDCTDVKAQRVLYKINTAKTAADLWLVRSDLHQCIAQMHSESIAAERINGLISGFQGWLPSKQLTRI